MAQQLISLFSSRKVLELLAAHRPDDTGNVGWAIVKLTFEHGARRDPSVVLAGLSKHGLALDAIRKRDAWPDDVELQVEGDIEHERLRTIVTVVASGLCPDQILMPLRIIRAADKRDVLYGIPCDDTERAISAFQQDIDGYGDTADTFRSWFRSRWMGQDEENTLTWEELALEPLTAERMLAYLDPYEFRDWRPIQSFIERKALCSDLVKAMELATTATQKWRLAYAFHRRGRSCRGAVLQLIRFLTDSDPKVREEAADSLGRVVMALRGPGQSELRDAAGSALLAYVQAHPNDNLYFARTALGATGYEPARAYLEQALRDHGGQTQDSARRALDNLNRAQRAES